LRLPHPQNIIVAGFADIGEFCTIYHNVSIAWNGFYRVKPNSPKIGSKVLLGAGSIVLGDISIGDDVLVGAGAVVTRSVPEHSRVTSPPPEISARAPAGQKAEPGGEAHLRDPYSIWR
jgi:serine O-acetyltransferase